jgi:hypothetical protein
MTKAELEKQVEELQGKIANLEINTEYATRIVWLIVNELGGNFEITKEMVENAQFTEVRVSDTVSGGLYIEVAPNE